MNSKTNRNPTGISPSANQTAMLSGQVCGQPWLRTLNGLRSTFPRPCPCWRPRTTRSPTWSPGARSNGPRRRAVWNSRKADFLYGSPCMCVCVHACMHLHACNMYAWVNVRMCSVYVHVLFVLDVFTKCVFVCVDCTFGLLCPCAVYSLVFTRCIVCVFVCA